MFSLFSSVKKYVQPRAKDNVPKPTSLSGKLHYQVTFVILIVASLLVSTYQYIDRNDKPIQCHFDKGINIEKDVINRFCWINSTFTLPKWFKGTVNDLMAYPGIGPHNSNDEVEYHAYYQWVPIVLALQALMFYAPHFVWKAYEGGRMKRIVKGMNPDVSEFNGNENRLENFRDELKGLLENDGDEDFQENVDILRENIEDLKKLQKSKADQISEYLFSHATNKVDDFTWTYFNYFYMALNLMHVTFQIFLLDWFLDGEFRQYGTEVIGFPLVDPEDRIDPMSRIFPKMTKCTMHKFGASGTVEKIDSLCVLSMNTLNEKIFIFLWFWFIFLSFLTAVDLAWKIYRHLSPDYTECEKHLMKLSHKIDRKMRIQTNVLQKKMPVSSWLVLMSLAESINPRSGFQTLLTSLAEKFDIEVSSTEDLTPKVSRNQENIPLHRISSI